MSHSKNYSFSTIQYSLLAQGYSLKDVADATRKTFKARQQLAKAMQDQRKWESCANVSDRAMKGLKNIKKFALGGKTGKDFADFPEDGSMLFDHHAKGQIDTNEDRRRRLYPDDDDDVDLDALIEESNSSRRQRRSLRASG